MPDIRRAASSTALVLNQTYEPLCVVSVRRAAILILAGKAVCVADGDGCTHTRGAGPPAGLGGFLLVRPGARRAVAGGVLGPGPPAPRGAGGLALRAGA